MTTQNKILNEVLLIDKPAGWTSFDVVAKIRGHFSKMAGAKIKVGHAGTLDPFATGLLIVLLGQATKEQDEYMKKDKVYEATLKLGFESTTGDPEGELRAVSALVPTEEGILKVLNAFTGQIEQTPPRHSAIKINGQRAYKLARAGVDFEIKLRTIEISSLEVLSYEYPFLRIAAHVSSGTYIRTLAEDIGRKLGTGAYLTELRRTKIGEYDIKNAQTIEEALTNV